MKLYRSLLLPLAATALLIPMAGTGAASSAGLAAAASKGSHAVAMRQRAFGACLGSTPANCGRQAMALVNTFLAANKRVNRAVEGRELPCLITAVSTGQGAWKASALSAIRYLDGDYAAMNTYVDRGLALQRRANKQLDRCL